jgi:hypothetical protein
LSIRGHSGSDTGLANAEPTGEYSRLSGLGWEMSSLLSLSGTNAAAMKGSWVVCCLASLASDVALGSTPCSSDFWPLYLCQSRPGASCGEFNISGMPNGVLGDNPVSPGDRIEPDGESPGVCEVRRCSRTHGDLIVTVLNEIAV